MNEKENILNTDISEEKNIKISLLNVAVIILSFYALGALLVETFWKLPTETEKLLHYFDNLICAFFLVEFFYNLFKAESKIKFLKWGWIDLVASIPMIEVLRFGRIFQLIRLLRIVLAFRTAQHLVSHVFHNRAKGTLTSALVLALLLIIFSSISILQVETSPMSNILTAEDAIWWAYTSITTVGYGDKYPVTIEGRIIAIVLMTFGVGLFGIFTAYLASLFVGKQND
ncbi:MAG: potassium channel family protein [bacterium]